LGRLNWWKRAYAVLALFAATAMALPAQTFTTLNSFEGPDGGNPSGELVQAANGQIYGTTAYGGVHNGGAVFKITPGGALTTLYSFSQTNGDAADPWGAFIQAANGDFFGITYYGGSYNSGSVFKITPGGVLTTLYSFCAQSGCPDGQYPLGLVQAANGDFYGTTVYGGTGPYDGTVFKITPGGSLTTLHSFCSQGGCVDGEFPFGLVQGRDGNFYGTTEYGGAYTGVYNHTCKVSSGCGTFYRITPDGTLNTLYNFCSKKDCTDGGFPVAPLIQSANGDFYGTTWSGGAAGYGTVFRVTPEGKLTALYTFCSQTGCTDGAGSAAGLIEATDGNFYGTTYYGGVSGCEEGCGTIFKITPRGALTTLYTFCSESECTDGANPNAGLVQATNGDFYGTTYYGGSSFRCSSTEVFSCGTVFSLSVDLGPFVKTQTTSGKVGNSIKILGTDLTGATSVTFNGTAATFTVNSTGTAISTTVPTGATTGTVQVVTPSGTLSSNVPFRVLP